MKGVLKAPTYCEPRSEPCSPCRGNGVLSYGRSTTASGHDSPAGFEGFSKPLISNVSTPDDEWQRKAKPVRASPLKFGGLSV